MEERSPFIREGVGDRGLDSDNPFSFPWLARLSVGLILDTLVHIV
jgi:hypothetical protein